MVDTTQEIFSINIEDELKKSYLDYAMSVIVGRALPDACDGLKPVHRRVLFAMHELNNDWNKPYKKSARVVGDVIGKYHPHGEGAVYDAIVRMAQDFSMRYTLIDGQGNFGSVDGDAAAAMRYTEVRMQKITHELMADLEKETVNFVPNYDGSEKIPEVFPTKLPNLLINGSSGIAVGMATNIPPHNLREVISGCLAVLENPEIPFNDILQLITGPDFPTGAIINGKAGILSAYKTGKGRVYVRSKAQVVQGNNRQKIVITELPYQVNKARLIEKIAELVKDKKIEGVSEIRDESDKEGLRVVIELRRGESGEVILNNLYAQTPLESVFGINMMALVDGQPKQLNLKEILQIFIRHRREVVTRRTLFELKKSRQKGHLLEGLALTLSNIDEVIKIIKASATSQEAQDRLMSQTWPAGYVLNMLDDQNIHLCRPEDIPEQYGIKDTVYAFSPQQVKAILEMRLHRLTNMEQENLITEYKNILEIIKDLQDILQNDHRIVSIIRSELEELSEKFGDERRTEIISSRLDLSTEDLIDEQDLVITLSHSGYIKTTPISLYQAQHRGGTGKTATSLKEEDAVAHMFIANTHTPIFFFSSLGKVYSLKGYQIPELSRISKGHPIVNLLSLEENEKITATLPIEKYEEDHYIFMATRRGVVKKMALTLFKKIRPSGLIAVNLDDDDMLVGAAITNGHKEVLLVSDNGKGIRFHENDVKPIGRQARGVRGMRLKNDQSVISSIIVEQASEIVMVSAHGFGKRSSVSLFRLARRGGQGVLAMPAERHGKIVGGVQVTANEEVMLISSQGRIIRTRVSEISQVGRTAQGVRLIRLREGEQLVGVDRVVESLTDNQSIDDTAANDQNEVDHFPDNNDEQGHQDEENFSSE